MKEIIIASRESVQPRTVSRHEPFAFSVHDLSEEDDQQAEVAIYVLSPGKSNYPYHYHMANEEIFYIISGEGILLTPDGERSVHRGEVLIFPPGERGAHRLTNASEEEDLVYLDVDVTHMPDVAFYPHSGKVGIWSKDFSGVYRADAKVPYYEGE